MGPGGRGGGVLGQFRCSEHQCVPTGRSLGGAPKLWSSQHRGLLNPGAGWGCTQRDPCTSPESTVLDRAPKSASSESAPQWPASRLVSSQALFGPSLALTPLLTPEGSSETLGWSQGSPSAQCLVLCWDSVDLDPGAPGRHQSLIRPLPLLKVSGQCRHRGGPGAPG